MVTNTDLDIGSVCPVPVRGLNLTQDFQHEQQWMTLVKQELLMQVRTLTGK